MSCGFPFLQLQLPDGGIKKIPYRQYILNTSQQFAVIGCDFDKEQISMGDHPGIEYFNTGKLNEQSFIFKQQIINSLTIEQWDFDDQPNPEIVIITHNS